MPLDEYRKKRDFTKSPEPAGDPAHRTADTARFFCVQKHLASHLHYDLRLEHDGVLLSWAVPKGPSVDPRDKRLAMQVEDHPVEYGSFEGVIPEGYGAGVVMLWDVGTWTCESPDVDAALRKGDLKFRLDGYKLKGSWALVRTRGYGDSSKPSWLLIKHRDDWAGPIDIGEFAPLSVKTPGADLADILAADTPDIWHSNPPAKTGDTGKLFQRLIATALKLRSTDRTAAHAAGPDDDRDVQSGAAAKPAKAAKAAKAPKAARVPKAAKADTGAKTAKAAKSAKAAKTAAPKTTRAATR